MGLNDGGWGLLVLTVIVWVYVGAWLSQMYRVSSEI